MYNNGYFHKRFRLGNEGAMLRSKEIEKKREERSKMIKILDDEIEIK